jgi:hypothetical protein
VGRIREGSEGRVSVIRRPAVRLLRRQVDGGVEGREGLEGETDEEGREAGGESVLVDLLVADFEEGEASYTQTHKHTSHTQERQPDR